MPPSTYFPSPAAATPDGLVAIGGDLCPPRLLDAYGQGIFPWPLEPAEPMLWWSPDPRAILPLDGLHVSRRLRRRIRAGEFQATCNQAFAHVLAGCATAQQRAGATWLTAEMQEAYQHMHTLGHAHSVEVWHDGQLAGGTYGLALGGLFAAESMFYYRRDASKVALYYLVQHLRLQGYVLLDVQQWTPHTGRLGAIEIPRSAYLQRVAPAVELPVRFGQESWNDSVNACARSARKSS